MAISYAVSAGAANSVVADLEREPAREPSPTGPTRGRSDLVKSVVADSADWTSSFNNAAVCVTGRVDDGPADPAVLNRAARRQRRRRHDGHPGCCHRYTP